MVRSLQQEHYDTTVMQQTDYLDVANQHLTQICAFKHSRLSCLRDSQTT